MVWTPRAASPRPTPPGSKDSKGNWALMGVRGVFYRQATWPPIRRIRLVAYGASLESWLGASPHGFESHILREVHRMAVQKLRSYRSFADSRNRNRRSLLPLEHSGGRRPAIFTRVNSNRGKSYGTTTTKHVRLPMDCRWCTFSIASGNDFVACIHSS